MRDTHLTHYASLHEMCTIKTKSNLLIVISICIQFHYIFAGREDIFSEKKKRKKGHSIMHSNFLFWGTNQTGTLARLTMTFGHTKNINHHFQSNLNILCIE